MLLRAVSGVLLAFATVPAVADDCVAALRAAETHRQAAIAATRGARIERRDFGDCPPLGVTLTRRRDRHGVTRRSTLDLGGDDSRLIVEHLHDAAGRLRLAVVAGGAVNGARLDLRVVFDASGNRQCERRRVSAPGYTFPSPWPDGLLLRDPDRAFVGTARCPTAASP